ncbi:MAG: MBL fold metallo-hydrolase [Clostridiales bacterium]|nr:MBL fold metallo-hydrolase [Clostridiales bacterium]
MTMIQRIKCKTDNCYLVANGSAAILVDTGYETVLAECSKYDMKLIVLTHVHFDHAENAARLAEHFNIPVAFHEADIELFEDYDKQPLMSYGLVGKVVLDMSLKVLRNTKVTKPTKNNFRMWKG